jgi:hypothetical protein
LSHWHVECAGPEDEQVAQVIGVERWVAVVPAIDHADDLRAPGPVAAAMHAVVHGLLHLIEVLNLVLQESPVVAGDVRVERAENDGCRGVDGVHGVLAKIVEGGKLLRRDVDVVRAALHLFVAALYGVGSAPRGIVQVACVEQVLAGLADGQQDVDAFVMISVDQISQSCA